MDTDDDTISAEHAGLVETFWGPAVRDLYELGLAPIKREGEHLPWDGPDMTPMERDCVETWWLELTLTEVEWGVLRGCLLDRTLSGHPNDASVARRLYDLVGTWKEAHSA